MFDPRSLRRKLGNLIPNDTRKQIQNVLTVEWDTHKTVLVEVPGAPPADADVEMEGMGLNRKDEREHGYGRLDDDWDDHEDLMNPNLPIEPPRRQTYGSSSAGSGSGSGSGFGSSGQYFNEPISRPQPPRSSTSDKILPPVPSRQSQPEPTNDPFADDNDFAPSNSFLQPNREPPKPTRSRTMEEGWNTFSEPVHDIRSGGGKEVWRGNDIKVGVESPTSSRGTRDSAQTTEENPFR